MVKCGSCGRENGTDSKFCENCGVQLLSGAPASPGPSHGFDAQMEDAGRRMGEAFSQMGRTWGTEAGKTGFRLEAWWDRTLGVFAPVVSGLIGVFVLLMALILFGMIADISERSNFWDDLISFVEHNMALFIALIFLNSFSNYLRRRYRKTWRWVIPVPIAIGSVGGFWIFAEVLKIAALDLEHPTLDDLGGMIELLLPVLFILVLILGYLMVFWITIGERGDEPRRYDEHGRIR